MVLCTYGINASRLSEFCLSKTWAVKYVMHPWEEEIIRAKQLISFEPIAHLLVITGMNPVHKTDFDNYFFYLAIYFNVLPGTC